MLTALVVDDDPADRARAAALLLRAGYRVQVAATPLEAFRLVPSAPFDLVLTDVSMPGCDGPDLLRALRRSGSCAARAVLLAMTSDPTADVRERCRAAGAVECLRKPLVASDFAGLPAEATTGATTGPTTGLTTGARTGLTTEARTGQSIAPAEGSGAGRLAGQLVGSTRVKGLDLVGRRRDPVAGADQGYLPAVGVDQGQDTTAGADQDAALCAELRGMYLRALPARLESVQRAFERGRPDDLARAAHALAGASGQFGEPDLARLCRGVENAARHGGLRRDLVDAVGLAGRLLTGN